MTTTSSLRREVLNVFKALHRTRLRIFEGDEIALKSARDRINSEFKQNKVLSDENAILEQIQHAKGVEVELRTAIVQAREVTPGVYEARINSESVRLDNVPFKDCDIQVLRKSRKSKEEKGKVKDC